MVYPCAAGIAKRDADAFSGITGKLQGAECRTAGTDGEYTLVTCTGTMALENDGERRDRSLASQTFRVKQVHGDWQDVRLPMARARGDMT